jgi:hypothetical protein
MDITVVVAALIERVTSKIGARSVIKSIGIDAQEFFFW